MQAARQSLKPAGLGERRGGRIQSYKLLSPTPGLPPPCVEEKVKKKKKKEKKLQKAMQT